MRVGDSISATQTGTTSHGGSGTSLHTGRQPETNRTPNTGHRTPKVLGVGNQFRRDDAVGLVVASRLADLVGKHVQVEISTGEGADLMNHFKDASMLVLVDAVRSGAPPGTIHRINAASDAVPQSFFNYSTHAFGVAEAIELARVLGLLPEAIILFGIEGEDFSLGEGLTEAAYAASNHVVESVTSLVSQRSPNPRG